MDSSRPLRVGLSAGMLGGAAHARELDGIGIYTAALDAELRSLGVATVRILRRGQLRANADDRAQYAWSGPLPAGTAWSALSSLPMLGVSKLERAIDVYHATDYLAPKLRRTPVVATLYDAIPFRRQEWGHRNLRGLRNWVQRAAAQNADAVIAISHAAVAEIVQFYRIPRERIRIVPLGVDREWFEPSAPSTIAHAQAALGISPSYFAFVGTLQPRKNLDTLLDAYERLPEAVRSTHQLVIAGRYGWNVAPLRRRLISLRAEGRVVWLEYVERSLLRCLVAGARALVFPSLAEGFGLPPLEAFATGTPVIASDLPVLREIAGGLARYVEPLDADLWAAAMQAAALEAPTTEERDVRRAWARRFCWRECARQTLEVYREVTGRDGASVNRPS